MLLISSSMPRSASLYYFRLTGGLLKLGGISKTSPQVLQEELNTSLPLKVDRLESWKIATLARKVKKNNICMIKTHHKPSIAIRYLLKKQSAKATYIFRDPRDVIVSALELGKKLREKGETRRYFKIGPYQSFARFYTLEGAIHWVNWQLYPRWKKWTSCCNVLITRYEDLVRDTITEIQRLAEYLKIEASREEIEAIIQEHSPKKSEPRKNDEWLPGRGPVLNKGIIGRYKTVLTTEQQEICEARLRKCLKEMGYC